MPSTYTPSLKLVLQATGENSGNWGSLTNSDFTSLVDIAVAGYESISMTDADRTLTNGDGSAANEARYAFINMTGTLTAAKNVIVPTASKLYFFKNSTTGGFALTVKTTAGTGISVPNGKVMVLMCDGTNVIDAVTSFSSLTLATALPVASGGTGAATLTGLVVGNGTSAMTTVTAPSGTVVGTTDTQTLTNKRVDPRAVNATTATALTPDVASYDQYSYSALASGLTINAPTGTPVDGTKLIFRILDNGTTRTITWNATFTTMVGPAFTNTFSTTSSKTSYFGCIYNAANTRWDVVAVTTQV
jgi:hypothetical protein